MSTKIETRLYSELRAAGVDEPAGGRALAVRAGHADEGAADGRVGDDLLPRLDRDAGRRAPRPAPGGPGRSRSGPWSRRADPAGACPSRGWRNVSARWRCPGPRARACTARARRDRRRSRSRRRASPGAPRRWPRPRPPRRRGSAPPPGSAVPVERAGVRRRPARMAEVIGASSDAFEKELEGAPRAPPLVLGPIAVPDVAPDLDADRVGDRDIGQPDRLGRRPAVRAGDAGHRDREVGPGPLPTAARPSPSRPGPRPRRVRRGRRPGRRPPGASARPNRSRTRRRSRRSTPGPR